MKRDPAIHIRRSDLQTILDSFRNKPSAQQIFEAAGQAKITDRVLFQANTQQRKKVEKAIETDLPDVSVERFQKMLVMVRTDRNHQRIRGVFHRDKAYQVLKDVAVDAFQFCETFDYAGDMLDTGLKHYVRTGLDLMGKTYRLNRFKSLKERIFDTYEAIQVVSEDPDAEMTQEFYEVYHAKMFEHTNVMLDLKQDPLKYVHVIYGSMEADEAGANYEDWIEGQFEGLAFLNAVPEVYQLHGDSAKGRWEKYIRVQGRKAKSAREDVPEELQGYFDKIRKAKEAQETS